MIAVPEREDSLALGLAWAHHAYTRRIDFREGWRGYLWQGRFFSCLLDDRHAQWALRYVERNPVRAGLVEHAEDWPWSSARAHVTGKPDELAAPASFVASPGEWRLLLRDAMGKEETQVLRERTRTGRPLGSPKFVERLERLLLRPLQRRKPGPKPKKKT